VREGEREGGRGRERVDVRYSSSCTSFVYPYTCVPSCRGKRERENERTREGRREGGRERKREKRKRESVREREKERERERKKERESCCEMLFPSQNSHVLVDMLALL